MVGGGCGPSVAQIRHSKPIKWKQIHSTEISLSFQLKCHEHGIVIIIVAIFSFLPEVHWFLPLFIGFSLSLSSASLSNSGQVNFQQSHDSEKHPKIQVKSGEKSVKQSKPINIFQNWYKWIFYMIFNSESEMSFYSRHLYHLKAIKCQVK